MKSSNPLDTNSRKAWYIAIVLWLVAVLAFFSPAIFNNKVIAPIDCLECVFRPFADKPIENEHNHFVVDGISQYLPYKWSIKTSFEEDGYAALVGWMVLTPENADDMDSDLYEVGEITDFIDIPNNPCIEVETENGAVMLPLHQDLILSVDPENQEIIMQIPAGLL